MLVSVLRKARPLLWSYCSVLKFLILLHNDIFSGNSWFIISNSNSIVTPWLVCVKICLMMSVLYFSRSNAVRTFYSFQFLTKHYTMNWYYYFLSPITYMSTIDHIHRLMLDQFCWTTNFFSLDAYKYICMKVVCFELQL